MNLIVITISAVMLTVSLVLCIVTIRKADEWREEVSDRIDLLSEILRLKLELAAERGEVEF